MAPKNIFAGWNQLAVHFSDRQCCVAWVVLMCSLGSVQGFRIQFALESNGDGLLLDGTNMNNMTVSMKTPLWDEMDGSGTGGTTGRAFTIRGSSPAMPLSSSTTTTANPADAAVADGQYIEFRFVTGSGHTMTIHGLQVDCVRNSGGQTRGFTMRSSTNSYGAESGVFYNNGGGQNCAQQTGFTGASQFSPATAPTWTSNNLVVRLYVYNQGTSQSIYIRRVRFEFRDPCVLVNNDPHGHLENTVVDHNYSPVLICDDGYQASGNVPTCNDAAPLTQQTCAPHHCTANPASAQHGSYENCVGRLTGQTCDLTCDSGYTQWQPDPTCIAATQWNGSPACMANNCTGPPSLPGGGGSYNCNKGTAHNTACVLTCDPGRYKVGSEQLCSLGSYQGLEPTCAVCPDMECIEFDTGCACRTCLPGHQSIGGVCQDCAAGHHCTNFANQCTCQQCEAGYTVNAGACVECRLSNCRGYDGSQSTCYCNDCSAGFQLSSGTCQDCGVNHCTGYSDACQCNDCAAGYQPQGGACSGCPFVGCQVYLTGCNCQVCATGYQPSGSSCSPCGVANCQSYSSGCQCSACNSGYRVVGGACQLIPPSSSSTPKSSSSQPKQSSSSSSNPLTSSSSTGNGNPGGPGGDDEGGAENNGGGGGGAPVGAIVGAIAGVAVIGGIAGAVFWVRRRRSQQADGKLSRLTKADGNGEEGESPVVPSGIEDTASVGGQHSINVRAASDASASGVAPVPSPASRKTTTGDTELVLVAGASGAAAAARSPSHQPPATPSRAAVAARSPSTPTHQPPATPTRAAGLSVSGAGGRAKSHPGPSLKDFLSKPAGIASFTEFLAKELSTENILFWSAVEDYRHKKVELCKKQKPNDPEVRKTLKPVAISIFNKFVNKNNINNSNVNLPEDVDERVVRRLQQHFDKGDDQEYADPQKTIFDEAQDTIFKLMETDSWARFQRTPEYAHANK